MNALQQELDADDIRRLTAIEYDCFSMPWEEADFYAAKERGCRFDLCHIAELIVGYCISSPVKGGTRIENLAISKCSRRKGLARGALERLFAALPPGKKLIAYVCDWNLDAQLFFRNCGFRAEKAKRNFFDDGSDAYLFVRRKPMEMLP